MRETAVQGFTGTAGNDTIYGNDGDGTRMDPSRFVSGEDYISGLERADVIYGLGGPDSIRGGPGMDTISGGDGRDTLEGGTIPDRLEGGAGDDLFVFRVGDGIDFIPDFQHGDSIRLVDASADQINLSAGQGSQGGYWLFYGGPGPGGGSSQVFLAGITEHDLGWVRDAIFY